MNAENFAYWLAGYFELAGVEKGLTSQQAQIVKDHLMLVFNKVTPDRPKDDIDTKGESFTLSERTKEILHESLEKLKKEGKVGKQSTIPNLPSCHSDGRKLC